jgi:Uncharacterized conserved protein
VKRFLEGLGFDVKGEICGCDLVALRADEPPLVVIGELKLGFNLELVLQGINRTSACDEIWLAVRASARVGRERDRACVSCAGSWVSAFSACPWPAASRCWSSRGLGVLAAIQNVDRAWSMNIGAVSAIRSSAERPSRRS